MRIAAKRTLARQLKALEKDESIERTYDNEKKRVVYRIKSTKAHVIETAENMVDTLGRSATYDVLNQLFNRQIRPTIEQEKSSYLEALKKEKPSFQKQLFEYLKAEKPYVLE